MKNDENKENSATSENKTVEKSVHKEPRENKLLQRVKKHGDKKTSEMSPEDRRLAKSEKYKLQNAALRVGYKDYSELNKKEREDNIPTPGDLRRQSMRCNRAIPVVGW